ncbi:tRNA uracil 4-sulfurtransferase [Cytobacillus horneckiae]|uniref:Probable tRNA sulfurtransferase n=1 Tax=Cytobacillus horneckiae TaxID=549687 RepID=A0A2N0ZAI3_9BACI|nr:tRNA uracil 4-sulfurtransferase ThiI [Cytobacillus horneckiae]MBN6888011.1 tRNA 4-thiouridine(8) synthase ThiI [Cytobacillus horneckiae]MEC1155002.1 tRNA 4-thiouridine(8) synthase ThiI [Cytobacillus horneckiae]MED2936092.1 tRNA 4-thiouridine(8) synthase ThiI [Cytobacillus horneckiae]PKG26517.1 tRNA 4-thiouridine(8) synthase ThiI [Cytobacillus horneckiae]
MIYDRILIRYGEISTKGRNRKQFVDKLRRSIKRVLHDFPDVKIEAQRDRMFILLNGEKSEEIIERLKDIFGIQSFSPAMKVEKDLHAMKEAALSLFKNVYSEGKSFKITAKRADKEFELDTNEINQEFGGHILKNMANVKVNVKQPDINLVVEVRKEASYISCENYKGAGGLPAGSSGKAMLMLSGGIDSPVAGYLSMKRGIEIEAVHFYSPPFTSERSKQKVIDLAEKLSRINGGVALHIVPFTEIQQLIQKQIPDNYTMTTTRRIMMRITDELRKKYEGLAIVTGESLGQVASQTMESMYAINEVISTPILRPLITMDKADIIDIAQEIDTHDISIRPFEDCCTVFVPSSPKTKPKLEKVQHFESFTDFEPYIAKAVENTEKIVVKPNVALEKEMEDLF